MDAIYLILNFVAGSAFAYLAVSVLFFYAEDVMFDLRLHWRIRLHFYIQNDRLQKCWDEFLAFVVMVLTGAGRKY